MTPREMQIAFERELNTQSNSAIKPMSDTTMYWINQAVMKFIKTRYSGTNARQSAFEQDQKRIDDLRTLVTTTTLNTTRGILDTDKWSVTLPQEYLFCLRTSAFIKPTVGVNLKCWEKDGNGQYVTKKACTIEVTLDTLDRALENSLSEHHVRFGSAKPLQVFHNDTIIFYTDGKYNVDSCEITYIKKPTAITLENRSKKYMDLPEHTHQEVVKLAVQMYLESVSDQRYNSYSNEVNTME